MYQLIIKPRAVEMQAAAYNWYEARSSGLGELFLLELDSCYDKLIIQPLFYSKSDHGFRHVVLRKFPFIIAFKIIKSTVVVYAVFHTSRNPENKASK